MFKILSMALISLVGMQYANTSGNNIKYQSSTPIVVGGTSYEDIKDDFLIPSAFNTFYYDGPTVPTSSRYHYYNFGFTFSADYIYFKTYSSSETMIDTRDASYFNLISYYSVAITINENTESFTWRIYGYDSNNNQLFQNLICYYTADTSNDLNGLERFYNDLSHYVFYVKNFQFNSYYRHNFTGYNGDSMETINISRNDTHLPFDIDTRFRSLERNYYFPYQPVVYGYWYKDQNTTYYISNLGTVGTYSRPIIFKGYFKCNGENFRSYLLDGTNNQQPSSGGWYFGKYNNVSSLSNAIRPSNGTQFWFASDGLYEYFNNGVKPVWYTQSTPVVSSNVEYNVLSNTYQWYSFLYQNIYLVYEEVDTSGNLTSISDLSYYDMLSFNTGFISTETDINPLTNALTLVGVAFQQLWSIGNIVLFGTITINSLILLPILVSLVIFIIHLIKRG